MGIIKNEVIMLAEDYQKKHPEVSWEQAMRYVCEGDTVNIIEPCTRTGGELNNETNQL